MLIKKAFNKLYFNIGYLCRSCFAALIVFILSCNTLLASNFPQSKNIANVDPDNKPALNLKYALEHSSLPLINEVTKLYENRGFDLLWSNGEQYNNKAHDLYRVIQNTRKLGLNPHDYDLEIIEYFLNSTIADPSILSKSDITFTHAYLRLASHVDHKQFDQNNDLSSSYGLLDNEAFLANILDESKTSPDQAKQSLEKNEKEKIAKEPLQNNESHYIRLLNALEKYRSLNDNFEPILLRKKSLTIGDVSPEVIKAKTRLYELGDYKYTDFNNELFDELLAIAIGDFQSRHGLEVDGILGKKTAREINKSADSRAFQIELNLERARQLAELQHDRYILVNVPEYKLYVIEYGKTIYQTRVIVGKKKNRTPSLSSEISEFVLNPYWNVPTSITRDEIIPKLLEDPDYLVKNDMKVISKLSSNNYFIDPGEVDWSSIDANNAPLRIRQDPGKKNALGRVKFLFPNQYKVYLHDTPSRRLFARHSRAFSHGCVRVENPIEFAEVLLSNSQTWTIEDLHFFANRKKTKVFKLDKAIPIHITYMTAWVDDQGIINFRPDIYKRDSHLASTLYNASH